MVTMTFAENHRTFTGCDVKAMACMLEGMGIDAVGINCSLGPKEIYPIAEELARYTSLPLVVKPNAGMPDPLTGAFKVSADEFAEAMTPFAGIGVQFVGGCCGTNPDYIRKLRRTFESLDRSPRSYVPVSVFCSATRTIPLDRVRIVGEDINAGKEPVGKALIGNDFSYIEEQAVRKRRTAPISSINVASRASTKRKP